MEKENGTGFDLDVVAHGYLHMAIKLNVDLCSVYGGDNLVAYCASEDFQMLRSEQLREAVGSFCEEVPKVVSHADIMDLGLSVEDLGVDLYLTTMHCDAFRCGNKWGEFAGPLSEIAARFRKPGCNVEDWASCVE